jgi:F420-dependent oxidoreductase-like protein
MDIALMIEGQDGLNWPRWQRLARAAEELGYSGLYRSDHFTNSNPPDKDSLELWISLAWLATNTTRITFGPLVSPVSFRHPAQTARMAAAVDDLSGGRLALGLGAGWQEREHAKFGFDLLDIPRRFARFEEGLQVITQLLDSSEPVSFAGDYYQLREAVLLPRPLRPGGPPVTIGGNGVRRTLPLVVRFASEWNLVNVTPQDFRQLSASLDEQSIAAGREPGSVRRTMMVSTVFGHDRAEVERKVAERTGGKRTLDELRQRGVIAGDAPQIVDQLGALAEAGVQRVMLQWLELDNLAGLEALAKQVLPQFPA